MPLKTREPEVITVPGNFKELTQITQNLFYPLRFKGCFPVQRILSYCKAAARF